MCLGPGRLFLRAMHLARGSQEGERGRRPKCKTTKKQMNMWVGVYICVYSCIRHDLLCNIIGPTSWTSYLVTIRPHNCIAFPPTQVRANASVCSSLLYLATEIWYLVKVRTWPNSEPSLNPKLENWARKARANDCKEQVAAFSLTAGVATPVRCREVGWVAKL